MSLPHTCVDCGAIHHEQSCPHCLQLAPGQTWYNAFKAVYPASDTFKKSIMFTAEELALLQDNVGWKMKPIYSTPRAVLVVQRVPKIGDVYPYAPHFRIEAVQPEPATEDGIRGTLSFSDGDGQFIARFWVPQNQATGHTADFLFDEVG